MKFLFFSEHGEIVDLASYLLHVKGHEVIMYIHEADDKHIGDGIVPKISSAGGWFDYVGKDFVWVFDSCAFGALQDSLREKGEAVFGGCAGGDDLENDRQLGQAWFKELGFHQTASRNFTDIAAAIDFVTKQAQRDSAKRWILKQNGNAPKSINHLGRFSGSVDMIFHLSQLERSWNEATFGPVDFDLMEVVEGTEVAASAFFNGSDFLRNSSGDIVGFLNFEDKKEFNDGLGETTGEMGTTFVTATERQRLFREIICRPAIAEKLRGIGFRGVFDINCIVGEKPSQITALEPTCRFGVPATSYEFIEALRDVVDPAEILEACATGSQIEGWLNLPEGEVGMVMVVAAKPFPTESEILADQSTSMGERLWFLQNGEPQDRPTPSDDGFSAKQREHFHLYNFKRTEEEGYYKVVTKSGYLLTVTASAERGSSVKSLRSELIRRIKDNIYLNGMKYRTDIGARAEDFISELY